VWKVPEGFSLHTDAEEPADVAPTLRLTGHLRKVGHVLFNPAAENVLASASGDFSVKLWDVEAGQAKLSLKHKDTVQSLCWNAEGSQLVTTSRDKKLRVWDVRQEKPAHEVAGHEGAKNSRAVWLGEHDRFATTGFSRMSDRQLALWDARNPGKGPMGGFITLDSISGVCMPFWDDGTQCLYLAGKGDGNIRYFEYENDKFEYLSEYKSAEPQRGVAFMPKRGVNLHDNEVLRCFKTVNDSYIQPVSFIVPRRAEMFQSDIYPPATGSKPGVSATEWFNGKTAMAPKISLESVYDGQEPEEVASEHKPSQAPTPVATEPPKAASKPAPEPVPEPAVRSPPPKMTDNKESLATQASKFADKDETDEDDEPSSFDDVSKPTERLSATAARQEEKTRGPVMTSEPAKSTPSQTATPEKIAPPPSEPTPAASAPAASTPKHTHTPSGAAAGLKDVLVDIKSVLHEQKGTLERQNQVNDFLN
jgi:coronin-1B/1C/6